MGDAYHSLEEHSSSDANFERSLKIMPENPHVLNNYSYYLSLRSESLEKAERMSRKSNELVPDEPTYQDTYGWVLFKMGRFSESEEWIRRALEKVIMPKFSNITVMSSMSWMKKKPYPIGKRQKKKEASQRA